MAYRQIRVVIRPGRQQTYVAVMASTSGPGGNHDNMVFRDVFDTDSSTDSIGAILCYVSDMLAEAADLL